MRKGQINDISGQKFGRLTAIRPIFKNGIYTASWEFVCDCGNSKIIGRYNVTGVGKRTRSCGCLNKENPPPVQIKHGGSKTKLYKVFQEMKYRCERKDHKYYRYYGARGINVCEAWQDFAVFREWSLSNGYEPGLDLDRIDNDEGYCPNNCRWITHRENLKNTRRKIIVNIHGENLHIVDAAEKYGMKYSKIYSRYKSGKRGERLIE